MGKVDEHRQALRKLGEWEPFLLAHSGLPGPRGNLELAAAAEEADEATQSAAGILYCYSKGMPRISTKNQVTIPVAVLEEAGLHSGDEVVVEALEDGELRIRRGALTFESAFGALTGTYPPGYLDTLDEEDEQR